MCEWLAEGEWCDVKLLCGGRTFNAHRAVLASVSAFLRRILLSSSVDEMTTVIVLPDFDLDSMSSVLYYIYHGEVTIVKEKLKLFLDIINAMQIYIDREYLSKSVKYCENSSITYSANWTSNNYNFNNIFTLTDENGNDTKIYKIKKGMENMLFQYSESGLGTKDVRYQNVSELHQSCLGNLKSPYGDRQRNSFLRDLFIETYSRNSNVNGAAGGVLAISNDWYRSPASVLSTNANGKHLDSVSDHTLSKLNKKSTEQVSHLPTTFHVDRSRCSVNCTRRLTIQPGSDRNSQLNCPTHLTDMTLIYGHCGADAIGNELMAAKDPSLSHEINQNTLFYGLHSSIDLSNSIFEVVKNQIISVTEGAVDPNSYLFQYENKEQKGLKSSKTILNQVLESPWSPRRPVNFKPFRRKEDVFSTQVMVINDNNNNVKAPMKEMTLGTPRVDVQLCANELATVVSTNNDGLICTQCNQVFTSGDALAAHSASHSASTRYSCCECGKTFSQLRNFKYHMSIHRGTREFSATCTVCGKYFNDRGYLSSHMKIHRNRKEYKCSICPKSFNQRVAYNMHVRIHTGIKPHVCDDCGKAFSRKMLLKQHQRTHSGERPYACVHCDKRFADRSNMTLHLRLHTGVKPFSCSMCPKSFTKKHHLKSHLNFHTGSKPYSCPRCNLAFTQSSNMRTHLKKCTAPLQPSTNNDTTNNNNNV